MEAIFTLLISSNETPNVAIVFAYYHVALKLIFVNPYQYSWSVNLL